MRLTRQILNNRVSRRVVLLFITAAILPLLLLAALTLYQTRSTALDQYSKEIRLSSKMIGMEIFQRLQYSREHLQVIASAVNAGHSLAFEELLNPDTLTSHQRIDTLFRLDNHGKITDLLGKSKIDGSSLIQEIHKLRIPGKAMLFITQKDSKTNGTNIYQIIPLDIDNPMGELLVGQLNTQTLFDSDQLDIRNEKVCILHENGVPLYCNKPYDFSWLSKIAKQVNTKSSSLITWKDQQGSESFSAFWSLFLEPHYQIKKWTVVVTLPSETVLTSINQFQNNFILVGLATLGLVILLSIFSIRRSMVPLEKLINSTRHLSRGIFTTRVEITGQDEFSELGNAFNNMATRLGNSFSQQANLIDFSFSLQHAGNIDKAISIALETLNQFIENDNIVIVYFEKPTKTSRIKCLHRQNRQNRELDISDPSSALDIPTSQWSGTFDDAVKHIPVISQLGFRKEREINLIPAINRQRVEACLILEKNHSDTPGLDKLFILTQFSDILASAISNIQLNQQLEYQALHDPLTQLPNRRLIKQKIERSIIKAKNDNKELAVMIMDIDRFKVINDSMGHAAGDELLIQLAKRLRRLTNRRDVLCRFAGDEFIFLFHFRQKNLRQKLPDIIQRLDQAFNDHFSLGKRQMHITASKGIAIYPRDGETYHELLKNADSAMYHAKHRKPGSYSFYEQALEKNLIKAMEIEQNLITALTQKEFVLHYQPCIHLATGNILGVEALIRWNHPVKGLIQPNDFISVAEQTGLIEPIGNWVLRKACMAFVDWKKKNIDLSYISVNVSSMQLQNPNFVDFVLRSLKNAGMQAHHLELEITETAFIEEFHDSLEKLQSLRELGVRIAVDDFGTGYASLKYLKELPANQIKIDRMFIKDLPESKSDCAIISALVALTRNLQLSLVAEGIETSSQKQYLIDAGVNTAQGFLMSHPLPEAELIDYIQKETSASNLSQDNETGALINRG